MPVDRPFTDPDEEDRPLRPAWEDTPDETDADRAGGARRQPRAAGRTPLSGAAWPAAAELPDLLTPLALATDALARLDARAAAAPDAVRAGLLARMAFAEAAGWLAHAHAWVHPLDLALRAAGLTASTALAAVGRGHRALPQTFAGPFDPPDWADAAVRPPGRRRPRARPRPWRSPACWRACRAAGRARPASPMPPRPRSRCRRLAASALDADRLAAWWATHAPPAATAAAVRSRGGGTTSPAAAARAGPRRRLPGWRTRSPRRRRRRSPCSPPPPAAGWAGREPGPPCAPCSCRYGRPIRRWASAIRTALPTLRSDAADRLVGRHRTDHLATRLPAPDRRKRPDGTARTGSARGRRGAGQGPDDLAATGDRGCPT